MNPENPSRKKSLPTNRTLTNQTSPCPACFHLVLSRLYNTKTKPLISPVNTSNPAETLKPFSNFSNGPIEDYGTHRHDDNRHITYPDSRLGQIGPHGDLFTRAHVRIAIARKRRLQLLQLLRGEVSPLSSLTLLPPFLVRLFGPGGDGLLAGIGHQMLLLLLVMLLMLLESTLVRLCISIETKYVRVNSIDKSQTHKRGKRGSIKTGQNRKPTTMSLWPAVGSG